MRVFTLKTAAVFSLVVLPVQADQTLVSKPNAIEALKTAPAGDLSDPNVGAPGGTVAVRQSIRAADTMSVRDFGAKGFPTNDTTAIQTALAWLGGSPSRKLTIPQGVWLLDGVSLDACDRCTLDAGAATLLWSGATKTFSDMATGIVYPQSVLLIRGDHSVNRNGTINVGMIDGWNLGTDGIFVSAGYAHTYTIGSIWFTRYALNYSPHLNYASESVLNVGLIKYTKRGIYESPDYLYAAQNKSQFLFFSHLTENVRFNASIIIDCQEYGIKRDSPFVFGRKQSGSNAINTFQVGAIDCTDYYDRKVDPISKPTEGDYKGATPIGNAPAGAPSYPGLDRPKGILSKKPDAPGAIDIRDDYEDLTAPTPVTSRSNYLTTYLGNSAAWLRANGGAGYTRSNVQTLIQDFTKFGNVEIDGYSATISVSGAPIASAGAWAAYTPTVTCGAGSIGSLGPASARWKQMGKTAVATVKQVIVANGTCAKFLIVSLPFTALVDTPISGRDLVTGAALSGVVEGGQSTVALQRYDGAYPTSTVSSASGGVLFSITAELP